eukprot:Pgem_evm1s4986
MFTSALLLLSTSLVTTTAMVYPTKPPKYPTVTAQYYTEHEAGEQESDVLEPSSTYAHIVLTGSSNRLFSFDDKEQILDYSCDEFRGKLHVFTKPNYSYEEDDDAFYIEKADLIMQPFLHYSKNFVGVAQDCDEVKMFRVTMVSQVKDNQYVVNFDADFDHFADDDKDDDELEEELFEKNFGVTAEIFFSNNKNFERAALKANANYDDDEDDDDESTDKDEKTVRKLSQSKWENNIEKEIENLANQEDEEEFYRPCQLVRYLHENPGCFNKILYAKKTGIRRFPLQYPGLNCKSSWYDIQAVIHLKNNTDCPVPCDAATEIEVTEYQNQNRNQLQGDESNLWDRRRSISNNEDSVVNVRERRFIKKAIRKAKELARKAKEALARTARRIAEKAKKMALAVKRAAEALAKKAKEELQKALKKLGQGSNSLVLEKTFKDEIVIIDSERQCGDKKFSQFLSIEKQARLKVEFGYYYKINLFAKKVLTGHIFMAHEASLNLKVLLELHASFEKEYKKKIFSIGLPGLSVPGLLKIGPAIEGSFRLFGLLEGHLTAELTTGLSYPKQINYIGNGRKQQKGKGKQLELEKPNLNINGEVNAELSASVILGLNVGVTIEPLTYVVAKAEVGVEAEAGFRINANAGFESEFSADGNNLKTSAYLGISGFSNIELYAVGKFLGNEIEIRERIFEFEKVLKEIGTDHQFNSRKRRTLSLNNNNDHEINKVMVKSCITNNRILLEGQICCTDLVKVETPNGVLQCQLPKDESLLRERRKSRNILDILGFKCPAQKKSKPKRG